MTVCAYTGHKASLYMHKHLVQALCHQEYRIASTATSLVFEDRRCNICTGTQCVWMRITGLLAVIYMWSPHHISVHPKQCGGCESEEQCPAKVADGFF